jgi:cold shock CspA family protein
MPEGRIKWFDAASGRGYITVEGQEKEVKVRRSAIKDDRYRNLVPAEPVTFEMEDKPNGPIATLVKSLIPEAGRYRGTVLSFDHETMRGFILPDGAKEDDPPVFLHRREIMGKSRTDVIPDDGESVEYAIQKDWEFGQKAIAVKRLDAAPPLHRFADMGRDDDWLVKLERTADDEDWQYKQKPNHYCRFPILKSYLRYTFKRLLEESQMSRYTIAYGRDSAGRKLACFNTGLDTQYHEPVIALFKANPDRRDDRPWKLEGFYEASHTRLHGPFDDGVPVTAEYYTDPSVLVYNRAYSIEINARHIAKDRIDRFPTYLGGSVERAAEHLDNVCAKSIKRLARNYKVAVPQFYRGSMQLLLPICLDTPKVADLALVVGCKNRQYRGATAITLDQAYTNARLITRPDPEWLKP